MKIWTLLSGWLNRIRRASLMFLFISAPGWAMESPSLSFLEFLAEEESENWIEPMLETETPETNLNEDTLTDQREEAEHATD